MARRRDTNSPLDHAYEAYTDLRGDLPEPSKEETEADTRARVIDRILETVLGWRPGQIEREHSVDGERLDYRLRTSTNFAVVEAKKSVLSFGLPPEKTRWYKLNGPGIRGNAVLAKAVDQVSQYALTHGSQLACVTNGHEWVVFMAIRTDGIPPTQGYAAVFRSLDEVGNQTIFRLFHALLSEPSVRSGAFRVPFLEREGTAVSTPRKSSRILDTNVTGGNRQRSRSPIAAALEPILAEVFSRLSADDNKDALRSCFVETKESKESDDRLTRLTEELLEDIQVLDTRSFNESKLETVVRKQSESLRGSAVLLLGQNGAGKSTFIDRFFNVVLEKRLRERVQVVTIDLSKAPPHHEELSEYLRAHIPHELSRHLFGPTPTYDQLKGIFFDEYTRLEKGTLKPLKTAKPEDFEIEFGNRLDRLLANHQEHLLGLLRYCLRSKRVLPVLVLDNADHFSDKFQETAFLEAQYVCGLSQVLLILPLRDSTYWRAHQGGAFHATINTTLYLPRPPISEVLSRRFDFAFRELEKIEAGGQTSINSLGGFRIGIKNPKALLQSLQLAFSRDQRLSKPITALAGGDVREALRIFHEVVASPHMSLDRLLGAYLASGEYHIPVYQIDRALMLGQWEHYSSARSRRVLNLLACPRRDGASPLLGYRICLRLEELRDFDSGSSSMGFVDVSELVSLFELLGVRREDTDVAIAKLLYSGLLEPYNLGDISQAFDGTSTESVETVRITESGALHLSWFEESLDYWVTMAEDCDIYNMRNLERLRQLYGNRRDALRRGAVSDAVINEKRIYEVVDRELFRRDSEVLTVPPASAGDAYASQRDLERRRTIVTQ